MLSKLRQQLPELDHQYFSGDKASANHHAAVLAAFTDAAEPELVLTRRSQHMRSHAGEVAFPGGKVDDTDESLVATALRESEEEIGLLGHQVELIGQIEHVQSRAGLTVQPYVGVVDDTLNFKPGTEELDAIFKVPVSLFFDPSAIIMHAFKMEAYTVEVPGFKFGEFTIWGLTASMIVKILNHIVDEDIVLPDIRYQK